MNSLLVFTPELHRRSSCSYSGDTELGDFFIYALTLLVVRNLIGNLYPTANSYIPLFRYGLQLTADYCVTIRVARTTAKDSAYCRSLSYKAPNYLLYLAELPYSGLESNQ